MKIKNDFHITPTNVIDKMVAHIPTDAKVVCDPFAGTGAILKQIPKDKMRCFYEIDETRAGSLIEKYHYMGSSFCQESAPICYYDCIVANPPFSGLDEHIENMVYSIKPNGTLILLLPQSFYLKLKSIYGVKLVSTETLGVVDFQTAKVPCFIAVFQIDLTEKGERKNTEINLFPTTEKGQFLKAQMFLFLGIDIVCVKKGSFLYPTFKLENRKHEADLEEWRILLNYYPSEYFIFQRVYDYSEDIAYYSMFFPKNYTPTIDEILANSLEYLFQFLNDFENPLIEYFEFLNTSEQAQSYIDTYYEKMPNLEELRNLSYRLYYESKILKEIIPTNRKHEFRKILTETYEYSLNL